MSDWNAALEAAAKLVGKTGFTFVRRKIDPRTMTAKIEILPGNAKIKGDYEEATHCGTEEMSAAAILSLRKTVRSR